jgi:CheY-like chemotaxis protein
VEDNVVNQKVALGFLRRLGLDVEIAADGEQAVARYRETPFDLIFMDVQMPVMDGYEATKRIRCESGGGSIPIVAMTANAMDGDRERCFAAGMNDYLAKPLQGKLVQRMVAKYLGAGTNRATQPHHFLVVGSADGATDTIADRLLNRWPGASRVSRVVLEGR